MNILQHIPVSTFGDVLVSLNPIKPPSPKHLKAVYQYSHPLYNTNAIRAQRRLDDIQGQRGIYYAGAWTGYGFHEDGFTSGLKVGTALGGTVPFDIVNAKQIRGQRTEMGLKHEIAKILLLWLSLWLDLAGVLVFLLKKYVSKGGKRGWERRVKAVKDDVNGISTGVSDVVKNGMRRARNASISSNDTLS
jgi:hypothetical protein